MKKLGKSNINSEKLIKDEELVNLRGGDSGSIDCYGCRCGTPDNWTSPVFDVTVYNNDIYAALDYAVSQCGGSGYPVACKLDWCTKPYYV